MLYSLLLRGRSALQVGRVVNVIDDVAGHGIGTRRILVRQISQFVDGVVQMLSDKRLPINWNKTKVLASSVDLQRDLLSQRGWPSQRRPS